MDSAGLGIECEQIGERPADIDRYVHLFQSAKLPFTFTLVFARRAAAVYSATASAMRL